MSFVRVLFSFVFVFLAVSEIQAQTLQFELNHKRVETAKPDTSAETGVENRPPAPPANFEESIIIQLAPTQIMVRASTFHRLYDFERQTLSTIVPQDKTYSVTPLFAYPVFKEMELRNRVLLAMDALDRGFERYPVSLIELEMMFGSDPNTDTAKQLLRAVDGGKTTYKEGPIDVLSYSMSDHEVPDRLADTFRKYLLHEFQIHPMIIEDLVDQGRLFRDLEFSFRIEQSHLTNVSYRLAGVQTSAPAEMSVPNGFERLYGWDKRLDEQVRLTRSTEAKSVDDYVAQMRAFLGEQKFVEAFLVYREFNIQIGSVKNTPMDPLTRAVFEKAPQTKRQVDVRTLSEAIQTQSNDPGDLEEAIAVIERAKSEVTSHTHVLDVFIANFRAMILDQKDYLREKEIAADLLLGALKINPHLAGAYHDLGQKYFDMFQMQDAWHCWDEMRRINPDHPLTAGIGDFEDRIRTYQASYF